MDVKSAIQSRRSIRRYEDKPIPKEVLDELLEAARLAPSSSNKQRWRIIVVTDPKTKNKLVPASGGQRFVGECSAYLVGISEPGAYYSAVDVAIAFDHLSLRATDLGLGTCWIGDFYPDMIKSILNIPVEWGVPICMTLGFPAQSPSARKRKESTELFLHNKWR